MSDAEPLERHPSLDERFDPGVRIIEHDPAWASRAREELRRLEEALGPVAMLLEHVGSTAVPGLAAKPILDLQLSVADVEPRTRYAGILEQLGYLFVPDPELPDYHFFARPPARPRSHHLHVCRAGGEHELRHLAMRDYLRAHGDEAAGYGALKRALVRQRPHDRLAYMAGKQRYVNELEARALSWVRANRPGDNAP